MTGIGLLLAGELTAASVNPGPGYTNDFATRPPAADWATFSSLGLSTDSYQMDSDVNLNITAGAVTNQTLSGSGNPAAANSIATWSSAGFLQTRPTVNRYTALMGKFVNDTGTNATQISISYLLAIVAAGGPEDEGQGTRVYYSLSGTANSWINLVTLSTTANTGSSVLSTNLALNWTNGGSLYLLWVDDNALLGTDAAHEIDNFSLRVTEGLPLFFHATVAAPTNSEVFVTGSSIASAATLFNGTAPYRVEYFTNSGAGNTVFASAGFSSAAPYNVDLGNLPAGAYNIYAVATDSAAAPESFTTATNAFFVADPILVNLIAPADEATFGHTTPVTGSLTVSGGTPPYSVQFSYDHSPYGGLVTAAPFEYNFGPLFVGDHTIQATATDARGWSSNSAVHTVHITGPLGVTLMPTNGASHHFGHSVILRAAPGGGTPPYTVTFYTNDQAIASIGSSPFTATLGIVPVGTYTAYVQVSDASDQAYSTTNTFTIVPNPLLVTLTNPSNNLSVVAGSGFTLMANATVSEPVTVTNVEFFFDGTLAGARNTAPYSLLIPAVSVGNHTVYAAATDLLGRRSYSTTNRLTGVLPGVPFNDAFDNAILLGGPVVTTTGSNTGATREPGEPNHAGSGGGSVWWIWTAPASGPTTIDTFGSSYDTLLGVYTGNAVNQLTPLGSNDDFQGLQSRVQFNAVAGTVYRVAVDGFFGSRGSIVLHITGASGITLSSPASGAQFIIGDPIPLAVSISTNYPGPAITRVDFYRGTNLLGSSSADPFTFVTTNAILGSNSFFAVAIDATGEPWQTPDVSVLTVNEGVTLLTPAEDTLYFSATFITVTATTVLRVGSITNVEFFVDGVRFGEDSTPPFSANWTNVVSGSHRFTAVARSDSGGLYYSTPRNIGVAAMLMPMESVWKYLDNGSNQGTNWIGRGFNDELWPNGPAPLGYGDSFGRFPATTNSFGPNPESRFPTTYYRQAVVISNLASFEWFSLYIERDDGAILYVNGVEIGRLNMPSGTVPYSSFASQTASDDGFGLFGFDVNPARLVEGTNVFAAEVHQDLPGGDDLWFQMEFVGFPRIVHHPSPLVSLASPTNGAYFVAPPTIPLMAEASHNQGRVTNVAFFAGIEQLGQTTNSPYTFIWTNPPAGLHLLSAVATDEQGASQQSAAISIVVYDAAGTPFARITRPQNGVTVEGGTNLLISAYANAITGVTNVQFVANGQVIGEAATSPYSLVWDAPFGTNLLSAVAYDANGVQGTSSVVMVTIVPNTIAPTIASIVPSENAVVSSLTALTINFSERVQGVDAGDLLINGVAATNVMGSGSNYLFRFPQPPYGRIEVTIASGHSITDFGYPADLPFNESTSGGSWQYTLIDLTRPILVAKTPANGTTVTNLEQISVTFSEPVAGVDRTDLLINGAPALGVSGEGADYTFDVAQPSPGFVSITWVTDHGITDLSNFTNTFNRVGGAWGFTLDTRVTLIQSNSNWRFVKGFAEASTPIEAWRQPGFDDSSWSNAPAPFYFGDPYNSVTNPGTFLGDMLSNYTTVFLRQEFNVESRGTITNLLINHQTDDGFIAWLNGVEVLRFNVPPGNLGYRANASSAAFEPTQTGAAYVVATLTNAAVSRLVNGTNILAVQAFNQQINSSDFGFNAHLYYLPVDATTEPPRLVSSDPTPGDLFHLTNVSISFSEAVHGVEAGDLLVNGSPAGVVNSTTNSVYTFSFPQPPYGPVLITWDTNHGIADFDNPQRAFNDTAAGSTISYTLINPSNPRVATQAPLSSSTVTGLTSIAVTFTEAVNGVEAADFLVNGVGASAVASADNITHTFSFAQPSFGPVALRWATNHGIVDVEAANPFDPTRFGGQWNYTLINPVPSVALTSPTNNTFFLPPATITLRATATDNDGTVALVEFFEGATKLGEGTSAPYVLGVSNLPLGSYVFRAVATDNIGLIGTSAPVVINVVTNLPIQLVRGPYLQSGSPTGGVVRWRTDVVSDGVVYYGTDLASLTNMAMETSVTNEHIVSLGGLEPNTQYFYSIGSSGYRLVGGTNDGANYSLKTSPPLGARQATRLWVLGDSGTAGNGGPERQISTREAFYNFAGTNGGPADLVLMLGDNAYNSGTDGEHQRAVFDMYPTVLRNTFLWPALGNHETSQSTTATDFPYLHIFSLPRQGEAGGVPSGTELYYSFDYGNIHFICLDSMTSGRSGTSTMARWLEDDLAATAQEWIIVYFHHPPYTKGSHDSDRESDLVEIRQNIVPILEAGGVDLVLNGHSHCLERSYLLDGHYGLSGTLTESMKLDGGDGREEGTGAYRKTDEGRGVVYSVAGSTGQATGGSLDHPAYFISLNELGTLVIDVVKNRLDVQFINDAGAIRDHYTLLKPDLSPITPLHLVALPGSDTEITLSWTPGATNQTGYSLERSLDGVTYVEQLTLAGDALSAVDTGLLANTTYYYRLRSTNQYGISDYSNVASATTVLPVTLPEAPAALVAAADDGVRFYRSQMILNWQDRSTNEAAFQIERSADGVLFVPIATVAANIRSYRDHHLASGTPYYYQVRSFNALGHSAPSNPAGDTTHPQSQLALAGTSATFHGGVEEALGYQWLFQGVPLAGQTNESLTIANAQPIHEGTYTVAITNASGRVVSNPAWLFVLVPPYIVENPVSHTNILGGSASFRASAGGTAPLYYQWRQDGVDIPGGSGPQLTLSPLTAAHQGQYDVVVRNEFGFAISQPAWLIVTDNRLPELAAVPDYHLHVLKGFSMTNVASDPDETNHLTFALVQGPTNATLHPRTGLFRWTPTRRQAPSTNVVIIRVDDNGIPNLSDTKSFTLTVNDYLEAMGGNVIINAGQTTNVSLAIYSSAGWTGLEYELDFPSGLLSGLTVESLAPEQVSATLLLAEEDQGVGVGTARINFTATPGQVLQGTQQVARLHFTAVAGQASGFVPLSLYNLAPIMEQESVVPTLLTADGRVVVLGSQALLEGRLNAAGQRLLTLYGRVGVPYTLQSRFSLSSGTWANRLNVTLTNVSQTISTPSSTAPLIYFRVRE